MSGGIFKHTKVTRCKIAPSTRKWFYSSSLIVLAGMMMPGVGLAQEWTGSVSNDWANSANWQGGSLPTASSTVRIDNEGMGWPLISGTNRVSGVVTIGEAAAGGSLTVNAGGKLTSDSVNIGFNHLGTSTITGAGSAWNIASDLHVGHAGQGDLLIAGGGNVTATRTDVGLLAGSAGTVTVSGLGSKLTNSLHLHVGEHGNGQLNLAAGGKALTQDMQIGSGAAGVGSVKVGGAGSTLDITGGLYVADLGSATLGITNGGRVTIWDANALVSIGRNAGSHGVVTVAGNGSKFEHTGTLWLGNNGEGSIAVSNSGTLTVSQNLILGLGATGDGTLSVTGLGSTAAVNGELTVGYVGKGGLAITAGGRVDSMGGFVGRSVGATGTVLVDGAGSQWDNSGSSLYIGSGASGSLSIFNGGRVLTQHMQIGSGAGAAGTVKVDGAGSALDITGGLYVADLGSASLDITHGGRVTSWDANALISIGRNVGSHGAVTVSGSDSKFEHTGTLWLGNNGEGSLAVSGAGTLTVGQNLILGLGATGDGTLSVTGLGSTAAMNSELTVGYVGKGSMTIAAGGQVHNLNGYVGRSSGGNGTVVVDGAGSRWSNSASLFVGAGTTGSLAVTNGGHVLTQRMQLASDALGVGAVTVDGAGSALDVSGGSLTVAVSGSATLDVTNGGRVTVSNPNYANSIASHPGSHGAVTIDGANSKFESAGALWLGDNGQGSIALSDAGTLKVGQNLVLGLGGAGDGSLSVTGSGTTATVNSELTVGYLGKGSLAITDGGRVDSMGGYVGRSAGGNGIVVVDGVGSRWNTGGSTLYIGTGTSGSVSVLNGAVIDGPVQVWANGTLGGHGTVGATEVVGGTLLGVQGQTLTIDGQLALQSGAKVNVSLGTPGNSVGLFKVNGNLTLDGTLNVTNAGGFGNGVYRIIDYTGSLTDNGMNAGIMPSGTSGTVQTAVANQVNLLVSGMANDTQFWNGTTTTADGTIHGGNGTWSAGPATNWTNASGSTAAAWGSQFAVFQNNPGTVTVDNSAGAVSTTGMQLMGSGWTVQGGAIALNGAGGNTTIRVGDGTAAGVSHVAEISSALSGNSRLVKDDLGTLILTGANTYTGGTTINAGALWIGYNGTTGSISGDVLNNALLRFARTDATTFGGLISGSGNVTVARGDLTFAGNNSYTGNTSILANASLTLGNGGTSGAIVGNVSNSGTLAFNRTDAYGFGGAITGNGAIRQVGSGKTELTGNSSAFTGVTTVESGILAVNGQLGGTLDVWTGGRLQGTGTVGNTIVSGVIAPGNSIGTINVGNITFNAGSIYEVEVNAAGQSDKILASGTATINGGSVQVLAGAGNYAPATTYTILTANGGRTGTFTGGVTSNLAFLDPSLSYDANNVYLTMTRNNISFQNVGITPNQIATGGGVESLGLGKAVYDAVLNLSAPQAQYAFDQLSGEIHASAKTAMLEDSRFIRNAVNDRIRAAFDGVGASNGNVVTYDNGKPRAVAANTDGGAVWGHAFGDWGHWNGDGNAARLDRSSGGFFVGADAPAFDTWRFGALAGYSRTSFNTKDRHASGTSDNYHVGLYGGTTWGDLAFRTGAAYTWHDTSTNRSVIFPGLSNSLTGDYGASTAQVFGELGYKMQAGNVAFEPFANLAYVNLHTEGFTEKGGAAALTSGSSSTDATFITLGLRAASSFTLGETVVTAKGMVGWRHAFGDVTPDSVMRFAGGGNAFTIGGVPIARNAAVVEAGLDFALSPTATLGVSYGGQFGSGVVDQSVRANFNVKF